MRSSADSVSSKVYNIEYLLISTVMTWLSTYYIYVLIVVAPGGLTSQLGVYPSPEACEAARETYEVIQPLRAECRERVRTEYGK